MPSPPEAEITRNWQEDKAAPVVSVCCIAYNHADYIAEALDSLLSQETTFPFEILVHDDASTDGTTDIIRRYMDAYPSIIRAVLQEDNQYSQKPIISPRFLFPLVKGKYVAMCEGDDFWVSADKLARQVAVLEKNAGVNLSFHPAYELDDRTGRRKIVGGHSSTARTFDCADIILGGGGFCSTASIVFRASVIPDISACVEDAPVSDKFIQIIASLQGGAHFIPETMAVYRAGHAGAWTQQIENADRLRQYEERIAAPYEWLYANSPPAFAEILRSSEADQYIRLTRSYLRANDPASAQRVLARGAGVLPEKWVLPGLTRWAARGARRSRLYSRLYPVFRSLYRYRVRSSRSETKAAG